MTSTSGIGYYITDYIAEKSAIKLGLFARNVIYWNPECDKSIEQVIEDYGWDAHALSGLRNLRGISIWLMVLVLLTAIFSIIAIFFKKFGEAMGAQIVNRILLILTVPFAMKTLNLAKDHIAEIVGNIDNLLVEIDEYAACSS